VPHVHADHGQDDPVAYRTAQLGQAQAEGVRTGAAQLDRVVSGPLGELPLVLQPGAGQEVLQTRDLHDDPQPGGYRKITQIWQYAVPATQRESETIPYH
jgi:hypothetical protein